MNPDLLFRVCGAIAVVGWLTLMVAGSLKKVPFYVAAILVPSILSLVYAGIFLTHWKGHQGGFNSLAQVQLLFTDRWLVLMGWVHYLAFDLFVGAWQVREMRRSGRSHLWTIPTLALTFLFGPIGFLGFLLLRAALAKKPHPERAAS